MKRNVIKFLLAAFAYSSTILVAQAALISNLKIIGVPASSSTSHPMEYINDNNITNYYKGNKNSFCWIGYDMKEKYVITQISYACPKGYAEKMQLGIFEGANKPDFSDAIPIHIIKDQPTEEKLILARVKCSRGFRYVRYCGPTNSFAVIGELRLYGNKGEGDDSQLYQLTNLPLVNIHTETGGDITSRDIYTPGTVSIISDNGKGFFTDSLDLRGRGNGSWTFDQKPYKMKFHHKSRVLDMKAKAKKWLLVNTYREKTLVRNNVGYEADRISGMPYYAEIRHVDVMLNGEYKGIYQLTDQIEVRKNRVDVAEMTPEDNELPNLSGGYLLEIDNYAASEPVMFYSTKFSTPINVHYPKDEITPAQKSYIQRYYDRLENRTFSYNCKDPIYGLPSILDVDSYLRRFLVGEFTANSDDWHQVFLYKDRNDPQFHFSPIWDLDLGLDNRGALYPTNTKFNDYLYRSGMVASAAGMVSMITRMIDLYDQELIETWSEIRNERNFNADYFDNYIDSMYNYLDEAQKIHFIRWPVLDVVCVNTAVARGSFKAEVDYLKDFVRKRIEWMDNKVGLLPAGFNKPFGKGHILVESQVIYLKDFAEGGNYRLANTDGRLVQEGEINSRNIPISVDRGVYALKVIEKDGNVIQKTLLIE